MYILWILLFLSLCSYAVFRYRRRRMYELAAKTNGLPALPLVGHICRFFGDAECIMKTIADISEDAIKNDGMSKVWLGPILYFVVVDPEDLEVILKACLEKGLHKFSRMVLGNAGIFAPVAIWRERRKMMMPAFKPCILENYVEVFAEQGAMLAKRLTEKSSAGPFGVWPFLSAYTLDAICETTMGVKIEAQKKSNVPYLNAVPTAWRLSGERILCIWQHPECLFKLSPKYAEYINCSKIVHAFTDKIINTKKEEIQRKTRSKTESDENIDKDDNEKTRTFLDISLSLSDGPNGYTSEELREEILVLIGTSTDTTAVTLGFVLVLLGKYPQVQEKIYQELREVFGKSMRNVLKEDLPNLVYMERVIKETLRLFPAVPCLKRQVLEEIQLPSGRILPGGCEVGVSIWGAHRDPKYWGPYAEHFDPDRFLPERFTLKHACSYMPFSNGPRNCLGHLYGMMSMKTALATVLRRCRVVGEPERGPIPNIGLKFDLLLKEAENFKISLVERK